MAAPARRSMGMADRRAVAALLRVAAGDVADAELLYLGPRNAWLLLGRAARRLWEAVLVSEHGLASLASQPPALDGVDDANPLKERLAGFTDVVAGAQRTDEPDRTGRLPEPRDRPPKILVQRLQALLDEAMRAFEVDPEQPDAPAGSAEPLRAPPPGPAAPPPAPRAVPEPAARLPQPRPVPPGKPPRVRPGTPPKADATTTPPAPARRAREAPSLPAPRPALQAAPFPAPAEPRHETEPTPVTSVAFWALMDRWQVDDLSALALVGHERKLTRKGDRPRFRLVGPEAAVFAVLRQIDATLTLASQEPAAWLRAGRAGAPLRGRTPLAHMTAGGVAGAREVHHLAVQESLARSMA